MATKLAALAINPEKYQKEYLSTESRILTESANDYVRLTGAFAFHARHNAAVADDERTSRLELINNPESYARAFFRTNPDLDDIHTLLSAINDGLAGLRFDGLRCLDLDDALTDLEDFTTSYNESSQRDIDRRAEAAEAIDDARREER